MTADFLFAFGAKATMNTTCLAETPPPDFEGTTVAASKLALENFGTARLWNGMERDREG